MERMRWKPIYLLLLLLVLVPIVSGCWDRLEIEDRANVLGISVDVEGKEAEQQEGEISHLKGSFPAPTQKMVRVTAQIAVPGRIPLGPGGGGGSSGGGTSQKPVWVVSVVGHTLDDAMMNLQQQLADRVFLSHLRVFIISEAYARQGVDNVNEYLRRNSEVRRAIWLLVSKGRADKLMKVSPELERVPALYLMATIENAVTLGKFPNTFLGVFWSRTSSLGQQPFLPYVSLKEKNMVEISGLAYFRNNKLVGVTKALEIGDYMAIQGLNPGGYLAAVKVPGTRDFAMLHTKNRKSKIDVDLQKGRPHATIRISYEAELEEKSSSGVMIDNLDVIHKLEQTASKDDTKAIKQFIKDTQKQGSDIFGFGEYVRAKQAAYWDENIQTEEKWSEMYAKMTFDVTVNPRIRRVGMSAR